MTTFPSDLPTAARFVLVTMAAVANGSEVTITREEIAASTGQSLPTVTRAVRHLVERGIVTVLPTPKSDAPGRPPRTYRIN